MKKLIALLLVLLPFVGAANAQEAKIAFVNTQEVFMALPEVADMRKQIDDLNANYQKELETMQNEFQKKYSDFIAQQDVNKKQQELIAPIQQKMADAIKAVGTEQGYTYIIDPQVLLYTGPNAIDATPFVKTKLGLQ